MRKSLSAFVLMAILIFAQVPSVWARTDTGSVDILVDLTPPEVNITGVADGGKYSSTVIPIVSAQDNSGEVTVISDLKRFGQDVPWVSGQEVSDYGTYSLAVSAVDKAGNKAEKSLSFILTTYAGLPTISIDKDRYSPGENMAVAVTDFNKVGEGNIEVTAYGIQGNPRIICRENTPGTFAGSYAVNGLLSGGFYVRYDYADKKYVEAAGYYVVSGRGGANAGIVDEVPNELPSVDLPGTLIGIIEGSETEAPSDDGDTAFFKPGADGYEYVPSIYDPVSGKYTILDNQGKYFMISLPSISNQTWASPAEEWFENRGIAPPSGENITTQDVIQVAVCATGINPGISDSTVVTAAQMEQIINSMVKASPVNINQAEINKWAIERRRLSKPLTKSEIIVTMYWFLQKANMAK